MLRTLLALLALAGAATGILVLPAMQAAPVQMVSPTVEVMFPRGHGSGTHLGNGYILTAAHVANEGYDDPELRTKTVEIRDQGGGKQWGIVLWTNKQYDLALVRIFSFQSLGAAHLATKPVKIGDVLHMEGNPFSMNDITTFGRVASKEQSYPKYWQRIFFVNGEVRPGMSGGGTFNEDGELVGVNVGQTVESNGFTIMLPSIGMIVPVDAFRGLLPSL